MSEEVAPVVEATPVEEPIPAPLHGPYSFLTGPAGTGKTYLARQMVREWPGTVLAATTGIASTNLGEGTTINALLRYFDTESLVDSYQRGSLTATLGRLWRSGVRRILLDEISMMDQQQLTVITQALEELRGRGYVMNQALADEVEEDASAKGEDAESRGISLNCLGDFLQLPPVKAEFAFASPEWARYAQASHRLTTVRRQADPAFIAAIAAARRGDRDAVCDYFGPRLHDHIDAHFPGLTVVATNDAADRLNGLRLSELKTALVLWGSSRWGKERGDWKNIPAELGLKVGALVMILANQREDESNRLVYANGDIGEVVEMDQRTSQVYVKLQRNARVVSVNWVTRQNRIPLEPGRKKQLVAEDKEHLVVEKWEIVGEITYMPIRLSYASTVHKCQGLSLDAVQVTTREAMFKNLGMLYVALSRARTADGLRLVGSVDGLRERVTVHPQLKAWV